MGDPAVENLDRLVGRWDTSATHPMLGDTVIAGHTTFAWLPGRKFLESRAENDHPDVPDSLSVIGAPEDQLEMHYFDSRGVYRVYLMSLDGDTLRIWRDAPGFDQRYEGRFEDGGNTLAGIWQLCEDGSTWNDDLVITYRRSGG